MKSKIAIVVLVLVALLLGAAVLYVQSKADEQKRRDVSTIITFSNQVVETEVKLQEQVKVNAVLDSNLVARTAEAQNLANQLTAAASTLAAEQAKAKAAAEAAAVEIAKRDEQITKVEAERDALDLKLVTLTANISVLNTKISETERKLAASEGDREFLLKELKRMQVEKSDLEKQFNTLATLRAQVSKLQEELVTARRLDWQRRGLTGDVPKGGMLLQRGGAALGTAPATSPGLNVELDTKGGVKVSTNAPPSAPKK